MQTQQQFKLQEIKVGDLSLSKFSLDLMAESIAEQVIEGYSDALDVATKMNAIEQLAKSVKDKIKDHVMDEIQKYPKNKAEINGCQISIVDTPKYDYSDLPGWQDLEDQIVALREKQKAIEEFEKKNFKGNLPVKSVTTTFKINLPK